MCELTGGETATSYETVEVGFFAENSLPSLSLTRVTPDEIAQLFKHYRNPELPTLFD